MPNPINNFKVVLSRRTVLALLASLVASTRAGARFASAKQDDSPSELRILYATDEAGVKGVQALLPEYEQLTGITITIDPNPYNNLQEKVFTELSSQSNYYDVICVDVPWGANLVNHLEPLTPYALDNTLSDPNLLQLDDFIPKVFLDTSVYSPDQPQQPAPQMDTIDAAAIQAEGFEIIGLPFYANAMTVTYRKDLFDEYASEYKQQTGNDLVFPETWEDFEEVAKFLTRPPDLYGTTLHAGKHEGTTWEWAAHLFQSGGRLFDENFQPAFNSPEGVQALQTMIDWIYEDKIAPPGAITWTFDDVARAFENGTVAMGPAWHNMGLNEPVQEAGGTVAYSIIPGVSNGGTVNRMGHFGTWQLSINKYSENKNAAFKLIEWLASPENQKKLLGYQHHVTRRSAFEDEAALEESGFVDYYDVMGQALEIGFGRPRLKTYTQWTDLMQVQINRAITQEVTAQEALDEAANQTRELLQQEGLIS